MGFSRVYKPRLASQSPHSCRIQQSRYKLLLLEAKKQIAQLGISLVPQYQPTQKGRMTGFLENNTSEEYERLRQAIGQPDYDTLPTGPHQPFTEEELRQVTQPLNLGDEHQGEANYAAIEGNNGESKEGGREEEGSEEGGDNEEAGADGLKEEAEGNTRGGKNAPGCKESEGGSKVSEVKAGEDARSSSPSNADTDEAHDNYSDGQDEFDRLVQGEETSEDEEEGESAQRDTAALGGRNDNEERWSLPLRYTPKHRRDSPRFVKRFEEKVTTMQVDLDGNLTAATRKAMERRRATDSGLGALEDLINRGAPPELGLLEEKSVAGIADLPLSPSQCSAAPSSIAAGDVSEVPPLSLDKAEAPFRVEDFLLSSPQEPGGNPPSFPTSLPLAAPSSSLQPSDGPALSPPYPWPPQAGRVPPHSRPLKDVAGMPPVYPHADTVMNPGERAPHPTPQSRTPDTEGVAKSNGDKALGVQKAPMKGNASKGRAQRACNVAQGISEATGGKSVFMQNGRRVRVVKVPRPTASEILPPRPPLYPVSNHPTLAYLTPVYPWPSHRTALNRAPPCPTQIPLADQPSPATQLPPQGVGNLPQELYVRRRQPGSSAGHAELVRLLDTLRNLPPRSVNRDESFRAAGPAPDGNLVSAPTNTTIPTSGNANVDMRGSGCPGQEQVSQGPGSEAEAATPTAQTPTERKSAKRKRRVRTLATCDWTAGL
eukprot:TRINITY_DN4_c0_g1_i11.p1 TRINITY_DN4_c0_g1~~TRINITY_DN4_c0_g1_i11.p1  ORF type:complete len:712 (+),score=86.20 TRINITY_DN4_c0_g1_i11:3571-5706(+)